MTAFNDRDRYRRLLMGLAAVGVPAAPEPPLEELRPLLSRELSLARAFMASSTDLSGVDSPSTFVLRTRDQSLANSVEAELSRIEQILRAIFPAPYAISAENLAHVARRAVDSGFVDRSSRRLTFNAARFGPVVGERLRLDERQHVLRAAAEETVLAALPALYDIDAIRQCLDRDLGHAPIAEADVAAVGLLDGYVTMITHWVNQGNDHHYKKASSPADMPRYRNRIKDGPYAAHLGRNRAEFAQWIGALADYFESRSFPLKLLGAHGRSIDAAELRRVLPTAAERHQPLRWLGRITSGPAH